jgi:predicted O-linked N-acetylglucosamine transferase (SPINDLY family)
MLQKVFDALQSNKLGEAELLLKGIVQLEPHNPEALHLMGIVHGMQGRPDDALIFLNQCLEFTPDNPLLHFNIAKAFSSLQRESDAIQHHLKAVELDPVNQDAWLNYGRSLDNLRQREDALDCYERAIALKPDLMEAWFNKGKICGELKRYEEALHAYITAYQLRPSEPFLLGIILHYKMLICDWQDLEGLCLKVQQDIRNHEKVVEPFGFQGISRSESDLLLAAKLFVETRFPATKTTSIRAIESGERKIRIAYLCGEFRDQATSVLMAGVYESHDHQRFDVYALDNGWNDGGKLRPRMEKAFKEIINISHMTDQLVIQLIQDLKIDILVNLNGYFGEARQNIFAHHVAPIQVNYLGFPGTLGAEYMDYIIADSFVIPPESRQFYVEKVAYLPNTYQANDSKRVIADQKLTRKELGLPESGFIFCSFNNSYKITPETFDGWMRILKAVDASILWLIEDNAPAVRNLKSEALKRGISPDRIIFATRLPLPEHLARHQVANLFLDTLPYNAHTTASDALWAELPVVTCVGDTFPGRVAASLLNAIGLNELITYSQEQYESLAIELATHPQKLQLIKNRLHANRLTKPLFNTALFTKHLEAAYTQMYQRYREHLVPDHIAIEAD